MYSVSAGPAKRNVIGRAQPGLGERHWSLDQLDLRLTYGGTATTHFFQMRTFYRRSRFPAKLASSFSTSMARLWTGRPRASAVT